MQSEEHVVAALRALARQDAELEAPLAVEDRVRKAFRRRRAVRSWRNFGAWSLVAAAMIVMVFVTGVRERRPTPAAPAPQKFAARPPQLAVVDPPAVETPERTEAVPASPQSPPLVRPEPPQQPRELVTQFFPLLDAPPPFEHGELLRVTVPASTMRKVGLPVNEDRLNDRVYADVLVGQEGLARAIRFVSYEQ